MSIPFYIPDDDVYTERQLMLGGPTGVPVTRSPGQVTPGLPQRWVAVDVLTRSTVDAGIRQPEPNRLVLCACINKYGCICYGYHDEIDVWSRWTLIFAVVFSILTTPLALLCFLPALKYMKRVIIIIMRRNLIFLLVSQTFTLYRNISTSNKTSSPVQYVE